MKKYFILILLPVVLATSCNKNCNDCGPTSIINYSIDNKFDSNVEFVFFGDTLTEFKIDTLQIESNKKMQVIKFISGGGGYVSDNLLCAPFSSCYDSLNVIIADTLYQTFVFGDCESNNPMCEANYKLVSETKDKKENVFKEYVFTFDAP